METKRENNRQINHIRKCFVPKHVRCCGQGLIKLNIYAKNKGVVCLVSFFYCLFTSHPKELFYLSFSRFRQTNSHNDGDTIRERQVKD